MTKKNPLWNRHHRVPRSRRGNGKPLNISIVPIHQHEAFHVLFGNKLPEEIARVLNETWIDPSKMFVVQERRKK